MAGRVVSEAGLIVASAQRHGRPLLDVTCGERLRIDGRCPRIQEIRREPMESVDTGAGGLLERKLVSEASRWTGAHASETSLRSTPGASRPGATDDRLAAFVGVRSRLFGIARRMLGNAAEAEDIVQDVWLRWQTANRSVVRDPDAFLTTAATRLAINRTKSACSRREVCVGTGLPEPVDTSADHTFGAERREALNLAMRLLLEKLSPMERAAYVLREAFNYEYSKIAKILRLSEVNSRQLVARGRKRIVDERRASVSQAEQRRLLEAFVGAAQQGALAALEDLFASSGAPVRTEAARRAPHGEPLSAAACLGGNERPRLAPRSGDESSSLSGPRSALPRDIPSLNAVDSLRNVALESRKNAAVGFSCAVGTTRGQPARGFRGTLGVLP